MRLLFIFPIMLFFLSACAPMPESTSIENADIFNWQNDYVTFSKFIKDHKNCIGSGDLTARTQLSKMFDPKPYTITKWDGIWASFQERSRTEVGQRIFISTPSRDETVSAGEYESCMYELGYYIMDQNRPYKQCSPTCPGCQFAVSGYGY